MRRRCSSCNRSPAARARGPATRIPVPTDTRRTAPAARTTSRTAAATVRQHDPDEQRRNRHRHERAERQCNHPRVIGSASERLRQRRGREAHARRTGRIRGRVHVERLPCLQSRRKDVDRILCADESGNVRREPHRHRLAVVDDEHLDVHIASLAHVHGRNVARLERLGQSQTQPVISRTRQRARGAAGRKRSSSAPLVTSAALGWASSGSRRRTSKLSPRRRPPWPTKRAARTGRPRGTYAWSAIVISRFRAQSNERVANSSDSVSVPAR